MDIYSIFGQLFGIAVGIHMIIYIAVSAQKCISKWIGLPTKALIVDMSTTCIPLTGK